MDGEKRGMFIMVIWMDPEMTMLSEERSALLEALEDLRDEIAMIKEEIWEMQQQLGCVI